VPRERSNCSGSTYPPQPNQHQPTYRTSGFSGAGRGLAHLALLLIRAGDIETNPGPVSHCGACGKNVGQSSILCVKCQRWHHRRCTPLTVQDLRRIAREDSEWTCGGCATDPPSPPSQPTGSQPRVPQPTQTPISLNATPSTSRTATPRCPTPVPPAYPCGTNVGRIISIRDRHSVPPQDRRRETVPLGIMQLNCNGIMSRLTELRRRIADEKPHVVLLQETLLKATSPNPTVPGYNVAARQDFKPNQAPDATVGPQTQQQPNHQRAPAAGQNAMATWTCRRRSKNTSAQWCEGCKAKKACQRRASALREVSRLRTTAGSDAPVPDGAQDGAPNPQPSTNTAKQGGILTLVREDIPFSTIADPYRPPTPDDNSYCVGTTIHPPKSPSISIINVYAPPARWTAGQGTQRQTIQLSGIATGTRYVVAGDFNAHGRSWDHFQPEDELGRELEDWATQTGLVVMNDSSYTRVNPSTGGRSAPDVTLVSGDMASAATWSTRPSMGSDHLPIWTTIEVNPPQYIPKRGRFNFKKADWPGFRFTLDEAMKHWSTEDDTTTHKLDTRFTQTVMKAAKANIPFGQGNRKAHAFWNDRCQDAMRDRDEALKKATAPGHSREDVERYKLKRAEADRIFEEERRNHTREEIANMGPNSDMWGFLKRLDGRRAPSKPAAPIRRTAVPGRPAPQRPATTDREKANLFVRTYQAVSQIPKNKNQDRHVKLEARRATENCTCDNRRNELCSPFSEGELSAALAKLRKGRAPGVDGITNDMLQQLSTTAKRHLLELYNKCWKSAEVPQPPGAEPKSSPSSRRERIQETQIRTGPSHCSAAPASSSREWSRTGCSTGSRTDS
jgi:hypothetical protein